MRLAWLITVALGASLAAPSATAQTFTLKGTVVTPADVITNGQVTVTGATIGSVGPIGPQTPTPAIDVDGVIFPGLIDLHDHITWNLFPRWRPARLFANRYEWQDTAEYTEVLAGPKADLDARGFACDMNRYGELKAIVNGATATVGGASSECIRGHARNLDFLCELVRAGTYQNTPWADTEARLRAALAAYRIPLAPLADCSVP